MPTIHVLKQSRFLTKEDVGKGLLLTITGYHQENVALSGEPAENKYCLDFKEHEKPLVLNSTKGQIIAEISGSDEMDDWAGTKIVLFVDPNVTMRGKLVGGIGVRVPRNQPASPPAPAPTSTFKSRPAPPATPVREPAAPVSDGGEAEGDDVPF